ncbi:hypothetical protein E1B28_012226 [Marasmius oreades]|uniref:guanosine-diphosphatase n=1 Tax=Marasmius oreades TaxID=181124 RepID=A0A9P7RR35_9AGAR|nr:uncharacterized protein E1B28_012226 [Marasmius oreades]KAG7088209.1 hypothetical protein E1B28_012226 [Marasmius oreades]
MMNGRPAVSLKSPPTHHLSSPSPARSTGSESSAIKHTARSRRTKSQEAEKLEEEQDVEERPTTTATMLSPRSSKYERLEGGMGSGKMGNRKRFGWMKFAIGAVVLIGLVWLFGPRQDIKKLPWSTPEEDMDGDNPKTHPSKPNHYHHTPTDDDDFEIHPPPPNSGPNAQPTSFEEDSDPTSTTHCTNPYSPTSSLVQWSLMIDAGSTGSRIHIYKFNNCQRNPSFEYEVFHMIKGGLSDYAGNPEEAAGSLDVLMDEALRVVPKSLQPCTPVAVKATAGLRLLPGSQSADILKAVERRLQERYPFKLHEPDGVVIMDGKDEGVYAWITANYLLDTIRDTTKNEDHPGTYAVLDLGGASTQIVFEPKFSKPDSSLEEGDHKYDLEFLGKKYVLYQHSYLGYGLMKARSRIHQIVEFMASLDPSRERAKEKGLEVFGNPCIAKGMKRDVEIEDARTGGGRNVTMVGDEIGSFDACNRVIELALAKDAICKLKPCSFNGVYQPSLLDTFPSGKVVLLSYFYDRLEPILSGSHARSDSSPPFSEDLIQTSSSSGNPKLSISSISSLARTICEGRPSWDKNLKPSDALMKELEGRPEYCLDLTFMHALLRLGYEFGGEKEVELGKRVEGTELGWCLGATISIVGGADLKCRV